MSSEYRARIQFSRLTKASLTFFLSMGVALACSSKEDARPETIGSVADSKAGTGGSGLGQGGLGGGGAGKPVDLPGGPEPMDPCLSDVEINSLGEWQDFVEAGCEVLEGKLTVGGEFVGNPLISMADLSGLREVKGDVLLDSLHVESLAGLGDLQRIGGSLTLQYNNKLGSLSELSSLTQIGGDLVVVYNLRLTELAGTHAWPQAAVEGDLRINNNTLLAQCTVEALLASLDAECASPELENCQLLNSGVADCSD